MRMGSDKGLLNLNLVACGDERIIHRTSAIVLVEV